MKYFLTISRVLFLFVFTQFQAQNQIPSWEQVDVAPELTGNSTLSINLDPSRLQAVIPAGIFFKHDGPLSNNYYWDFGNGVTERGAQASHIYEIPGTYTVSVTRVDPETNEWGTDEVEIVISDFTGETYYIDSINGDDSNLGTSPLEAWQTAEQVRSFISNGTQTNQRFLFKRGQIFPLVNGNLMTITRSNLLRLGAYANNDGSDDTTQDPPTLTVDSDGFTSTTTIINAFANNQDLAIRDINFKGDYEYIPPPNDPTTRKDYPSLAISLLELDRFVLLRSEISHLNNGVYLQAVEEDAYVHDSYIHHVQTSPVFGAINNGYSLRNNTLAYASQSHMHYVGANEAVIKDNLVMENGASVDVGRDPWFQCGIRLNSASDGRVHRVYMARNHIKQITGETLCIGQNFSGDPHSLELVIEENILDGQPTESGYYWDTAPIAGFQSVEDVVFRNNALINVRNGIHIRRNGAVSRDINISNNTFHMGRDDHSAISLDESDGDIEDVFVENNIFIGSYLPISLHADAYDQELHLTDNIFWNDANQMELYDVGAFTDFADWSTNYQATNNVELNPQLISMDPESEDFIIPATISTAMESNSVIWFNDFTGILRDGSYIGAREPSVVSSIAKNNDNELELIAYPNPFNESTEVVLPESLNGRDYVLLNLQGEQVLSGTLDNNNLVITTNQIAKGVYMLKIEGTQLLRLINH